MRKYIGFLAAAAVAVGACSDVRQPTAIEVEPLQSHTGCDLSAVTRAARSYLPNAHTKEATDRIKLIEDAGCTGAAERLAWEVLRIVDFAYYGGGTGPVSDGLLVINGLMDCCIAHHTALSQVLGSAGMFAVRGALPNSTLPAPYQVSNSAPVVSRSEFDLVFGSEDGEEVVRPAIIGLRPKGSATWSDVANGTGLAAGVLALTGFPTDDPLDPAGATSPYVGYRLDEAPDISPAKFGTQVEVVFCFTDTDDSSRPYDPHLGTAEDGSFTATVRRNGLILEGVVGATGFCDPYVPDVVASSDTSPISALVRFAASVFLPQPLAAFAFSDTRTDSFGGGLLQFSFITPSNAINEGELQFVMPPTPPAVVVKNVFFDVKVKAMSGGGAPAELVELEFYATNNLGQLSELIGQALFQKCDGSTTTIPTGCTGEDDGTATVKVAITKAGGNLLCVRAKREGFTFPDECLEYRIQVRNN